MLGLHSSRRRLTKHRLFNLRPRRAANQASFSPIINRRRHRSPLRLRLAQHDGGCRNPPTQHQLRPLRVPRRKRGFAVRERDDWGGESRRRSNWRKREERDECEGDGDRRSRSPVVEFEQRYRFWLGEAEEFRGVER